MVARDFGYEVKRTQEGNAVFGEGPECSRKLCVVAVADNAPVSGYPQAESVPCGPSFIAPDKGFPAGERTQDKKNPQPPVGGDDVVHLHENQRRQWEDSAILRHELPQLR